MVMLFFYGGRDASIMLAEKSGRGYIDTVFLVRIESRIYYNNYMKIQG